MNRNKTGRIPINSGDMKKAIIAVLVENVLLGAAAPDFDVNKITLFK